MSCPRPRLLGLVLIMGTAAFLPACKNKNQVAGSDLKEAGYQMTADDWFRASGGNDVEALKKFISGGFSKDTKNADGDSALHVAAAAGAENSANYLLGKGISINEPGANGRTPLMVAVISNKPSMVRWLLRQGADPKAKDGENFRPLMLAVREGSAGSVAELAAYDREDLDPALLLAALLGKTQVIDSLTNYGASVYARMEDGRTPLMVAAENGHLESANLLLDIGASRLSVDSDGKTAADLAIAAGHPEIAAAINREPTSKELVLESPAEIAAGMDQFVAAAEQEMPAGESTAAAASPKSAHPANRGRISVPVSRPSRPIEGAVLGKPHELSPGETVRPHAAAAPVVMRHYQEKDVPIEVANVAGDTATLKIAGAVSHQVKVKAGDTIPGSRLVVIKVRKRIEDSKVTDARPMEVAVVEVSDRSSGSSREWISGRPSTAHDPIALVEDPATGQRYTAVPGQRFKSADGGDFRVSDVRPNQIVIEDLSNGTVQTIALSGPRG